MNFTLNPGTGELERLRKLSDAASTLFSNKNQKEKARFRNTQLSTQRL